ncbi:MAG: GEVED domain-containing protein [Flavobacteriaceae bacterium]|jgi:hypothetical protein|nr:GEVED domain-containing protein [Flavobacteriaceae bacterium]
MKQLYYFFFAFFWWSMCIAQDYVPLQITSGFNEDVIAENHPASTHTTTSVDATNSNANNALMSINYPKATVGLPVNGLIASIASATPGLTFQLAPYNQNNTLIINATNGTGTLAVQTTEKLITLYILATSGSSSSTFTGTITFTDATTQTFASQIVPDWYDQGTPAIAIRGIGRVPRTGTEDPDNNTTNPKLFQVAIDISSANQNKIIQQVDFTKTSSTSGFLNILALSGEITPTCFKPVNLGIQNLTATSVDLTWTSAGNMFDIKWGKRDFNVTTAGTLVTSFANNGTLSGLTADTNYDYYVRRDCGAVDGISAWAGPFQFRTGYCIPIGAKNNGDEIRNFKLSNLNNNSNASEGTAGYMDYSGTVDPAILEIGEAYVASLTSGTGTGNHGATIWIDYNNNLVFEENEKVSAIGNTISPNTTANFPSFTVPATVKPGLYRLRVQYHYNKAGANLDPCILTSEFGETEDYEVQIIPEPSCFPPLNIMTPGITKNSVNIVWDAPIEGTSSVLDYQYEVRTSGLPGSGSTGLIASNTTGAGVLNTSVTGLQPSTTHQLYVRANCGSGSFSEWTAAHEFTTLCDPPNIISVKGGTSCGAGTTTLEATSDKGVLTWFETETSIAALGTGTTFITPKFSQTTSFWVSATEELASGSSGKEKIGVSLYDATISNRAIIFNVAEEIILESTDIYTNYKGTNIEIQIIDSLGKEIYSTGVITLNHTGVTTPNVVPLHAVLKPGKGYQIKMKSMTNGILWDRDTNINFPYIDSNGLLEVIASLDNDGQLSLHDYFYFYNLKYTKNCTSSRTEVVATVTDVPTFTLSETELVLCKGASSSAVTIASGAVSNADYTWLPATGVSGDAQKGWVFNPSVSTTYQLTVSVNGCEAKQDIVVQVIDITLTSSQTNIKCHGGSTGTGTVDVSGGTPPYTYAWDTNPMQTDKTAMNLTAGTYNVIITDKNGCTIDQKFIITEPTALSITSEQTDVSCNGGFNGTATVSVSGGTGGYTYSWSSSGGTGATASGLTAGTYTVTVTDANSCTATASVIITEPNEVEKPKVSTPLVYNYGDVAQPLTAEANTGNTLLWYTTATGATGSGNAPIPPTHTIGIQEYWVSQITAVGCESARELITVEITPAPLTITAHPQTKIYGEVDPTLTYDVVGFKKGETAATVLTGSLARDAGENTGVYIIQQGNLQANGNYVLTYKQGELQIAPAPLQITPQKGQTKVYGQKDAVLQYTAKGFKFADTVAVLSGELGRQQGEQVGVYIYTQGTLSTVNNNYKIAVVAGEQYTITPAPLTVKANANQSKVYGTKDPVFTYQITGMQFSESAYYAVTGALSRKQGEDVGLYAIEQGSLIARANYVITSFVSADFEIKKAKIEGLRLPSETFVYDGQPKSLKVVGDMPSDAVVTYTNNGQINVGKYAVFVTVDYGKNYEILQLNGELFIEQATQEITFAPISKVVLEDTPTLQLTAKASSNLPITYTIDSQEPANVATIDSKTGVLTFLQPGQVVVTAHQEGNVNYKAAKPVSQTVEITSRDASIWDLLVDGVSYGKVGTEVYVSIGCDKPQDVVMIEVKTQYGAVVVPSALIEVNVKEYGIHQQLITVTSMDGTVSKSYKVIIEKRIPTEQIIFQKYDNILLVNKNTSTNGGYVFTGYQWYKNGEVIGKKQTYSAGGEVGAILESGAEYHVELTLYDGRKIVSCPIVVAAKAKTGLVVYPNPVNKSIHTQVNIRSQRKITQGVYTVYTLLGQRIAHGELYGENMSITLPNTIASGSYFLVLKGEDVSETVQFIVKE